MLPGCVVGEPGAVRLGVEPWIAAEVETGAVPVVAAGLQRHADESSGAVAGFRVHAVLRYHDFLYRVGVGRIAILMAQADRTAVYLKIVLQVGAPAQVYAVGGPGMVR